MRAVIESIEVDLHLLGISGVEDRLQEDVKPTLELLKQAGIRIWMLTGDKVRRAAPRCTVELRCFGASCSERVLFKIAGRSACVGCLQKGLNPVYEPRGPL